MLAIEKCGGMDKQHDCVPERCPLRESEMEALMATRISRSAPLDWCVRRAGARPSWASNLTCAVDTEGVERTRHDYGAALGSRYAKPYGEDLGVRDGMVATEGATRCVARAELQIRVERHRFYGRDRAQTCTTPQF